MQVATTGLQVAVSEMPPVYFVGYPPGLYRTIADSPSPYMAYLHI